MSRDAFQKLVAEPIEVPRELAEWHAVGGWLLGAYAPPPSVRVSDDRLQWVLSAIIGVHATMKRWPVDVVHVAATLRRLGVYDQIGGTSLLLELLETWDERVSIGEELGELLVRAIVADVAVSEQVRTQSIVLASLAEHDAARARVDAAFADLHAATERRPC